jgi:hypothetical protein
MDRLIAPFDLLELVAVAGGMIGVVLLAIKRW